MTGREKVIFETGQEGKGTLAGISWLLTDMGFSSFLHYIPPVLGIERGVSRKINVTYWETTPLTWRRQAAGTSISHYSQPPHPSHCRPLKSVEYRAAAATPRLYSFSILARAFSPTFLLNSASLSSMLQ